MEHSAGWCIRSDGEIARGDGDSQHHEGPSALVASILASKDIEGPPLHQLAALVKNNEFRDYADDFTSETYQNSLELLIRAWKDGRHDVLHRVESIIQYLMTIPEFDPNKAKNAITEELLRAVMSRFEAAPESEDRFLREFLHLLYNDFPACRPMLRALIGRFLGTFIRMSRKEMAVAPILEVLGQVIKGFKPPMTQVHRDLLLASLLPLHKNNEMYEWRDQIPLIQLYHEPLVFCLVQYLERDPSLTVRVLEAVLRSWPEGYQSNSPKEVLCLHEVETLLKYCNDEDFQKILHSLLPRLERCLMTDHSRCLEKALTLWKNETVLGFTRRFSRPIIRALLRSVYRGGEMHWSVTVNKMRAIVLDTFHSVDPKTFGEVASTLSTYSLDPLGNKSTESSSLSSPATSPKAAATSPRRSPPTAVAAEQPRPFHPPKSVLLGHTAGGWRPPTKGSKGEPPPLTITGVAPWAMSGAGGGGGGGSVNNIAGAGAGGRSHHQPPVTITGVAPWAQGPSTGLTGSRVVGSGAAAAIGGGLPPRLSAGQGGAVVAKGSMLPPPAKRPFPQSSLGAEESVKECEEEEEGKEEEEVERKGDGEKRITIMRKEEKEDAMEVVVGPAAEGKESTNSDTTSPMPMSPTAKGSSNGRGQSIDNKSPRSPVSSSPLSEMDLARLEEAESFKQVMAFIAKCRPAQPKEGEKTWHEVQMEPTPTLIPDMKFHDLVFGQDLGSGAFSTVKYARHIAKGKTRSDWSEYAVKIINTSRIVELGYEACVNREIAVLRLLSHPGIARMVSAFRWRDGAYLVLEYASKGDLHSHIVSQGSLNEESARFVLGEVIAALRSVHDAGFVYGDLKPENVVITESGHIKITDFGACRPFTDQARQILKRSHGAVRMLRDGDWDRRDGGRCAIEKKKEQQQRRDEKDVMEEEEEEEEEEDERIEGTFAYLPPEVIRDGAIPDVFADAWALGCLLYQCLTGRPPVIAELEQDVRARVVSFAEGGGQGGGAREGGIDGLLKEDHAASIGDEAKELVKGLLTVDKRNRFSLEAAAVHGFFTHHEMDVYNLHRGPAIQLVQGTAGPTPDAVWNRRQFSAIWAPLPGNYSFVSSSYCLRPIPETALEAATPFCYESHNVTEEQTAKG